jgi:hypothetical protein
VGRPAVSAETKKLKGTYDAWAERRRAEAATSKTAADDGRRVAIPAPARTLSTIEKQEHRSLAKQLGGKYSPAQAQLFRHCVQASARLQDKRLSTSAYGPLAALVQRMSAALEAGTVVLAKNSPAAPRPSAAPSDDDIELYHVSADDDAPFDWKPLPLISNPEYYWRDADGRTHARASRVPGADWSTPRT